MSQNLIDDELSLADFQTHTQRHTDIYMTFALQGEICFSHFNKS